MKLLCITDPSTHPSFDTTLSLYRTFAADPEIDFFHAPVSKVDASGFFHAIAVTGHLSNDDFMRLDEQTLTQLSPSAVDLVFSRADEPVPKDFFENLSRLEDLVRFVNRPSQLAYTRCKDFLEEYGKQYLPDHIFSSSYGEVEAFFKQVNPIVAKSNVGYGGKGVYKIWQQGNSVFTDNVGEISSQLGPAFPDQEIDIRFIIRTITLAILISESNVKV